MNEGFALALATVAGPAADGVAAARPRRWAAAVVMMTAALMDLVDVTIVNAAPPSPGRELGASENAPRALTAVSGR